MTKQEANIWNRARGEIISMLNNTAKNYDKFDKIPFQAAYFVHVPNLNVETTQSISRWSPELHKRLDKKFKKEGYIYFYGYIKPMDKLTVYNKDRFQYVLFDMDGAVLQQQVMYKKEIEANL